MKLHLIGLAAVAFSLCSCHKPATGPVDGDSAMNGSGSANIKDIGPKDTCGHGSNVTECGGENPPDPEPHTPNVPEEPRTKPDKTPATPFQIEHDLERTDKLISDYKDAQARMNQTVDYNVINSLRAHHEGCIADGSKCL